MKSSVSPAARQRQECGLPFAVPLSCNLCPRSNDGLTLGISCFLMDGWMPTNAGDPCDPQLSLSETGDWHGVGWGPPPARLMLSEGQLRDVSRRKQSEACPAVLPREFKEGR